MKNRTLLSLALAASLTACLGGPVGGGGGYGGAEVPSSMQPAPGAPSQEARAMAWNLHYNAPEGWSTQDLGSVTLYSQDTSRAVFVGRAMFQNYDEALMTVATLSRSLGLQTTGVVEQPTETTIAGLRATVASYAGTDAMGMPSQGRLVVLFTTHGTSLTFFGVSDPSAAGEVAAVMDRMAESTRHGAPAINTAAVASLAGRWMYSDGRMNRSATSTSNRGTEATLVLDGNGGFQFGANSWVSIDVRRVSSGSNPVDIGGSDSSRSTSDAGQYTVIGLELVFRGSQGQLVVPFMQQGSTLTLGTTSYLRQ